MKSRGTVSRIWLTAILLSFRAGGATLLPVSGAATPGVEAADQSAPAISPPAPQNGAAQRDEKASPRTPRPWNIVVIVTDDQGAWALGAYGNSEVVTPNMDRLAREGALFRNAFAASGVCTPSRVALLSGLFPIHAGFTDVPYRRDRDEGLPLGVPSWPRVLKSHGYSTGLVGKWHLGRTPENYPTRYGIDYFFGFLRGGNFPVDPVLVRDGIPKVIPGPLPDILVDDALDFIQTHQSEAFALMLHFRAPHAPHLPVPPADMERFRSLDPTVPVVDPSQVSLDDDQEPAAPEAIALHIKLLKEKMRTYYAAIHSVDRNLGRLIRRLDELDLADRTILVFTSDQGYLFGHRGLKGKGGAQPVFNHTLAENAFVINLFDHTLKVPLLVRWPGVVKPGTVIDELVSNVDLFPSILGMLNVPAPGDQPCDGMDFSPLLRGKKAPWRDAVFAEYTPDQIGQIEFIRMIRTGKWKLVRTHLNGGGNQLFDLENDPQEMNNLYYLDWQSIPLDQDRGQTSRTPHPYGAVRDRLQKRLTEWQNSIHDPAIALEEAYEKARQAARGRWR